MRKIQFADFELDLELFKLKRGDTPIVLGGRALDLLIYLIENRERVVESKELREKVWHAAALSPSSIPTCVRELRIALQDDANHPKLIETSRKRGYRFIGQVSGLWVDEERDKPLAINLPFVGRKAELEVMNTCLRTVVSEARCHLLLIRGEAGIGKTRLVTEFISRVRTDVMSYIAKSPLYEGTPGFWPWTQILREALADQGDSNHELAAHARALSTVFPEVNDGANLPDTAPIALDRFSILSRWANSIRSISSRGPLLLVFEDVHRADVDTLTLLSWICEELCDTPVLIVATRRPRATSDLGAGRLNDLSAVATCTNFELGPLTASQIAAMMDPLIDDRETLGQALRYRTDGNAFYTTSLIRILGQKAISNTTESVIADLPPNAEEIVSHQLSDLPDSTRQALAASAVAGGRIQISVVSRALALTAEELIVRLEPAKRACFIVDEGSDYRFSHSLLRDALYQTLDSGERRALHLSLALAIIDFASANSKTPEIAEHLLKAIPIGDPAVALKYLFDAGREAATRFAYSKAQSFFRSALGIVDNDPGTTNGERGRILLALAEAQLYAGNRDGSSSTLREAAMLARSECDTELLASCALQLAPDFLEIEVGSYDTRLIALLREALIGIAPRSMALHSQVLARLSQALRWSEHTEESEKLSIEALRIARKSKDKTSLSAALAARADSLHGPDRLPERAKVTAELQKIVRSKNSITDTMMQHIRLISTHLEAGDIRELDAAIQSCENIANEMNVPQYLWYPKAFTAMRKLMTGDFASAIELGQEFRELGERSEDANVRNSHACQTGCVLIEMNQAQAALPTIAAMASKFPLVRAWSAGEGFLHLRSGNLKAAREVLGSFDDRDIHLLFREAGGNAGVALLAEISSESDDSLHRRTLYDLCCRAPLTGATLGFGIAYFGCFHRYAGLLARRIGLANEAIEHLRRAVGLESRRGAIVFRAHAEIDLAQVLVEMSGRNQEVRELIHSAQCTADSANSNRLHGRILEFGKNSQQS